MSCECDRVLSVYENQVGSDTMPLDDLPLSRARLGSDFCSKKDIGSTRFSGRAAQELRRGRILPCWCYRPFIGTVILRRWDSLLSRWNRLGTRGSSPGSLEWPP